MDLSPLASLPQISDPVAHLAGGEARFDDIKPGAEKQILWLGDPGAVTDLSVVYLHGFSACSQDTRPLPDQVATALGANLYLARLAGHGRTDEALGEATLDAWLADLAEAMAIGTAIGRRVVILASSTGATLATCAAIGPAGDKIAGMAFLSPNFGVRAAGAGLLTWPLARHWVPWITGRDRTVPIRNPAQARWWPARYPITATIPMAHLVRATLRQDLSQVRCPTLMIYCPDDQIVSAAATEQTARRFGGPVTLHPVDPAPGGQPEHHVLCGDVFNPAMTGPLRDQIVDWARAL